MRKLKKSYIITALVLITSFCCIPIAEAIYPNSADQMSVLGLSTAISRYMYKNMIGVDTNLNIVLPVATGKKLSVTVNGTEKGKIDTNGYTGAVVGSTGSFSGAITTTGVTNTGTISSTGIVTASAGVQQSASVIETVAAGTSVQGDGPLTAGKFFHQVTGFDETKVVTLPACAAGNIGEVHFIQNGVTNKFAKVFPATGATINALGANTAYVQGVTGQGGKTMICFCQAANQWFCG